MGRDGHGRRVRLLAATVVAGLLAGGCAWLERSSVGSGAPPPEGDAPSEAPSISQTGRFVAFTSSATNLVPDDDNGVADVFVRDHVTGATERVSVASGGGEADGPSGQAAISDDGRYVAFSTTATNLVAADGDAVRDVLVRDRASDVTSLVSIMPDGSAVTDEARDPVISGDGSVVAFTVNASFMSFCCVPVGPFVRDLAAETTTSMPTFGGFLLVGQVTLSDDGSRVAYGSVQPPVDPTTEMAPFTTVVVDVASSTTVATVFSGVLTPSAYFDLALSGDGSSVALVLASGTPSGPLYRFDVATETLDLVLDDVVLPTRPSVSDDGSVIALHETPSGSDKRYVVTDPAGSPPKAVGANVLGAPAAGVGLGDLSGDGKWVAFDATDPKLVPGDTNGVRDVFLRSVEPSTVGPEAVSG
jgi:Tol biopolymer transport system component